MTTHSCETCRHSDTRTFAGREDCLALLGTHKRYLKGA